jgi:hypothetical protein
VDAHRAPGGTSVRGEAAATVTQPLKIRLRKNAKGSEDQLPTVKSRALEENDGDEGSGAEREPRDDSGEEESPNLLECVRRVKIVDPAPQESSNARRLTRKNPKNTPSQTPPGGLLGRIGVPGERIPTMEGLHIKQYSNTMYWKFAPYLEHVRCETGSLIC